MIPLRLSMRNFLSYTEPEPIDFTRFDVACLSGENGSGKSALLDAMTYSLFGAARGCENGQNQERLIREGADEAVVDFTFELGGATYQVVRKRTRAAKGNEVRFHTMTPEGWTNLAKDSIRETDRHIQQLLRMDYKTFVNSAFFLQGRADEFLSAMTPDDRKEVFAKLLDLGAYELLESAARERVRAAERTRAELAAQAARLAESAPDPSQIEADLDAATAAAEQARAALADADTASEAARQTVSELERQQAVLEAELRGLGELEQSAEEARSAVAARRAELEEIDALLTRADEVRDALEQIKTLTTADEQARAHQLAAATLREEVAALEERMRSERAAVDERCVQREIAIAALERDLAALHDAEADLDRAHKALADSTGVEKELERVVSELDQQRTGEGTAREGLAAASAKLAEVDEKLELLKDAKATCPLCGGALDEPHRRDIARSLRATAKELGPRRKQLDATREVCRKEVRRLSEEATRLTKVHRERSKLEGMLSGLEARVERGTTVRSEIDKLRADDASDRALVTSPDFAAELRARIEELTREITQTYDPGAHAATTAALERLRPYEKLHGSLTQAEDRRPRVEADLARCLARESELTETLDTRRKAVAVIRDETRDPTEARAAAAEAENNARTARTRVTEAETAVATLTERLASARRVAEEVEEARTGEIEAAAVHRRYECLVKAFGRGGIPDRIIGNALPELRDEANDILGRLSDFEMSLQFRLDKETKSGKIRETFDVLVSHDGGVRDFRMFSGGEAFRIAFAVRLALSKLLVRRAGARLQTLVIDEGFGTQDPTGRERLIEAIDLARDEFTKVLVITHLDELKDVFGAQIRVTKDPMEGSRLEICS